MAIKDFCRAHFCDFRDKCVVFACTFKFANLIQYDMQYIPCNNALLAIEALLLLIKNTFFYTKSSKKCANRKNLNLATK